MLTLTLATTVAGYRKMMMPPARELTQSGTETRWVATSATATDPLSAGSVKLIPVPPCLSRLMLVVPLSLLRVLAVVGARWW